MSQAPLAWAKQVSADTVIYIYSYIHTYTLSVLYIYKYTFAKHTKRTEQMLIPVSFGLGLGVHATCVRRLHNQIQKIREDQRRLTCK